MYSTWSQEVEHYKCWTRRPQHLPYTRFMAYTPAPKRHLTPCKKAELIGAYQAGSSLREVAAIFNVPHTTVHHAIHSAERKETPSQRGKKRKTTTEEDNIIEREALSNTRQTLCELNTNIQPSIS